MPLLTTGAGKYPAAGGGGSPTFTFRGSEGQTFANVTNIATFTTIDVGTAAADRFIIVAIANQNGRAISALTVAGTSLAKDVETLAGGQGLAIFSGLVTSGSGVQNILATAPGGAFEDCSAFVYSGTGMSNTTGAAQTVGDIASATSSSISVNAGDLLLSIFAFTCADSGSTEAPTNTRTQVSGAAAITAQLFEWNTVIGTNASFTVGRSISRVAAIAAYR